MMTKSGIRVTAYVTGADGEKIPFEALSEEQKRRAATELKARYLGELFRGRAVFREEGGAQ